MDEIPSGFRSCLSCTQSCYKEHWPFKNRDCFRAPCFVKALCDSNLAAMATCWMVIPSAWLKLYGDDVGNSAILLGPSGNTWQVGVSRPKWVAFRVGWRTFAADNCLEKGDMLVFTLIGKSKFSVKIYDNRTCLEKESSLTAINTGCYDSRSPVLLGEKRKQRDNCENVAISKRICSNDNEELQFGSNDQALESFRNGIGLQQSRANISTFSSATLISQRKSSLLDLNSKPLNTYQNPNSDGGRDFPVVNQQLLDAVDARTLQEYASGDSYQPHPISIRSRDLEEDCSRQGQFKAQECGSGGIGPATRFAAQRRPVMDTTRERHPEYQCRQNSSSALITSDPSSQALDLNREHFAEGVGPQILPPAVILERGKALEIARRAQDTIDRPSHLVVLRAFHVHGRAFVRFPVTFGKQHMPRKTAPMHLIDYNGHRWPMTWLRDNETHMGLTRGWRDFCLAERLSEGDVCIFELIEFNKLTLLIHVFRSTETRGNTQAMITRSKRLDMSNAEQLVHEKPFERKFSEEGQGQRKETSSDDKDRQPTTIENQYPFMPTNFVFYNTFHRTALPSSVRLNKGCNSGEYSTAGSVGRVRFNRLSIWASKSKDQESLSATGYSRESESQDGMNLKRCGTDDAEMNDGDMSKAQDTAYGEILCQMSSGCGNVGNNNATAQASSMPQSERMGITGNDCKVHTSVKHKFKGQNPHALDRRRNHGNVSTSRRPHDRLGVIPGRNAPKQWAKTRKLYRKVHESKTLDWTRFINRASCCSALKRKMQASNRNPRFYIASRRSSVTQAQKEAAIEAACALNTENPTTLVVMKHSNVYNTYNVELPSSFSRQLSSGERSSILLSDAAGHKTKANLTHTVITRGWRQFSLEHLLEEGDVCVFEHIDISQRTVLVHIFRVVEVDHLNDSYHNHYRFISLGILRKPVNNSRKTQSHGQVVKEIATSRTCQPRRTGVNKNLYLALRNTRTKRTAITENEWFFRKNPLDLNLNLDPVNISLPVSNVLIGSPSRTISTSCAWRTLSKYSQEMNTKPLDSKESGYAHQQFPISGNDSDVSGTSAFRKNVSKDDYETSPSEIRQEILLRENEKMIMRLPGDADDSEPEEEHYYRVVRILKKRYFGNEKQYLTELDGPVMQGSGCEGIRDHDDMKWWVPEKSFSSGFASCYLR